MPPERGIHAAIRGGSMSGRQSALRTWSCPHGDEGNRGGGRTMRVVHRLSFVIAPGHTNATARFVSDRSFELSAILAEAWENGEVPEEHVPAPFSLEIFPAADHAAAIRIVDPSRSVGHTGRV